MRAIPRREKVSRSSKFSLRADCQTFRGGESTMRKSFLFHGTIFLFLLSALSAQSPAPLINQPLLPSATTPGGPQFTLTVNGTGFVAASAVNWNGNALATTFVSSTELTAIVPATDIATASTSWVTVVNPAPGGGTSNVVFLPITTPTPSVAFSRTDITTGSGPTTAATGDFNGDGKLDLVISNNGSDNVSILLGNGDGTFQAHKDYAVGSNPSTVLVGDFNNDGKLDLAVRNEGSGTIAILLGNGDGTFRTPVEVPTGDGYGRIVSGDFNGDGNLDLATTNDFDDTVSILLGNGDGTFKPHVDYPVGSNPIPIAEGDVNGDGNLDLVVGHTLSDSTLAILLGNGDGTFQSYTGEPTLFDVESVVLADFNGDGILDLAVFSEAGGIPGIEISLGNGDGTFRSFAKLPTSCGSNFNLCGAAAADCKGDGNMDLGCRKSPAYTFEVLLGNGDGTFKNPVSFPTGENPSQVTVGDFNGDGRLDLVVPAFDTSFVSVFIQQAPGPAVTLSTSSLDFGSQLIGTESDPKTVILTNSGTATLDITGMVITAGFLQNDSCGPTLLAGKHCVIKVAFRPGGVGIKTGTLTITDSAPGSPQIINLRGVSTALRLSGTSVTFGSQTVGTTSGPLTITLTNHSSYRVVAISKVLIKGGNFLSFAQTNPCGTGLAAGASCTFSVTFTPHASGTETSTLYIWNGGGEDPMEVALSGTGT